MFKGEASKKGCLQGALVIFAIVKISETFTIAYVSMVCQILHSLLMVYKYKFMDTVRKSSAKLQRVLVLKGL